MSYNILVILQRYSPACFSSAVSSWRSGSCSNSSLSAYLHETRCFSYICRNSAVMLSGSLAAPYTFKPIQGIAVVNDVFLLQCRYKGNKFLFILRHSAVLPFLLHIQDRTPLVWLSIRLFPHTSQRGQDKSNLPVQNSCPQPLYS